MEKLFLVLVLATITAIECIAISEFLQRKINLSCITERQALSLINTYLILTLIYIIVSQSIWIWLLCELIFLATIFGFFIRERKSCSKKHSSVSE